MKRYQSHKVVEAAQIAGFANEADAKMVYVEPDGEGVAVPGNFFSRGYPKRGDYLVRYQPDGYLSWSPRAAFEAGYTEVRDRAPCLTWQDRAKQEAFELNARLTLLRAALLAGKITDPQSVALMQRQYKAMEEYHAALELRLRHTGVIDTETPPTVRETPAHVSAQIETPPGKRAVVIVTRDCGNTSTFTVVGGQRQAWDLYAGDVLSVREGEDHDTVAHKRPEA